MRNFEKWTKIIILLVGISIVSGLEERNYVDQLQNGVVQSVNNDCGGVVEVSETENSVIEYKTAGLYTPNERCIWTIVPDDNTRTLSQIVIYFERQSFEQSRDGLVFYSWSVGSSLRSTQISLSATGTTVHYSGQIGLLYFSSDNSVAGDGLGFRVILAGIKSESLSYSYESWQFPDYSCNLEFSYPLFPAISYNPLTLVSVVLQQSPNDVLSTELSIQDLRLSTSASFVVYRLGTYAQYTATAEYTYSSDCSGVCRVTESTNPRVVLFYSGTTSRRGFLLNWS